jgi:hypothetical protein
MIPMTAGKDSSEHERVRRAELVGLVVLGLGVVLAIACAVLDRAVGGAVGVALATLGAHLVAHPAAAYVASRGAVKVAAAQATGEHLAAQARPRVQQAPRSL